MSGAVVTSSNKTLRGWARLEEDPSYPVTVHLVSQNTVLKSKIADEPCSDAVGPETDGMARLPCWFEFDLDDVEDKPASALRVVIGESGECVFDPDDVGRGSREPATATRTYRDALAAGLSEMDVLKALYQDILRRPSDEPGLRHLTETWARGRLDVEKVRWSLLTSWEYQNRHKLLRDAAGNAFRRDLLFRTAQAVVDFESLHGLFVAQDLPLRSKLILYFPGLLIRDGTMQAALRDAELGLPERELFFRTLSRLADRPALVLDPTVLRAFATPERASVDATEPAVTVPCASTSFLSGWHKVERAQTSPRRWMRQIGVIRNPQPERPLTCIEVDLVGSYADPGALVAASDGEELTVAVEECGETRQMARIASTRGAFGLRHLVLMTSNATSPMRHTGSPDPRLISIQVSQARFISAESA